MTSEIHIRPSEIQALQDRFALQDLLTAYCYAVDRLDDVDGLLDLFTPDAEYDLSGIGLLKTKGHEGIRTFFTRVFKDMAHHAHYNSNFTIQKLDGDTASTRAYVTGMGIAKDGNSVTVHVDYYLDCVRTENGWKIARFYEEALIPMPSSLTEIHGEGETHVAG